MSQSTSTSSPTSQTTNQNPFIHQSSSLAITMTISNPSQSTSRHRTRRYRPIQRSDGIVVVHPLYTSPSTSHSAAPKFEPQPLNIPPPAAEKGRTLDIQALRARLSKTAGRDGYNVPSECGRGGYNGLLDQLQQRQDAWDEEEAKDMIMQRFLDERGPWSVYEVAAR